jgi:hypothetical protein
MQPGYGRRTRRIHVALVRCGSSLHLPDYVPYMNQLASERPPWEYLSDSNVEWGDDIRALAAYLRARGEKDVRAALSGGWGRYDSSACTITTCSPRRK